MSDDSGPFGPIFRSYRHDARGAVARLLHERSGEAPAALHHPEIGDIDLVWGCEGSNRGDGSGLAKITRWHPEMPADLQGPLDLMRVVSRSSNRARLESATHYAVVSFDHFGNPKVWLLSAFAKSTRPAPEGRWTFPETVPVG